MTQQESTDTQTARVRVIRFRVFEHEREKIKRLAKDAGLSISDYIRSQTINKK